MKDLDLGRLATALGLLRLPRMPELRGGPGTAAFVPSAVNPALVKVGIQHLPTILLLLAWVVKGVWHTVRWCVHAFC